MSTGHKNEKEIFETALQLSTPSERVAYLESVCGDDSGHKARILALLQAQETGDNLLDPLLHDSAGLMESRLEERPGTVIGRYKLLERIGEGGMAVVYMAEQTEPIRRKVALKIIKLGMDTRQVIARFEAERQALALMDHPSIAKVLDAGATETGRPYFVMELVQGVSITEYCDKNSLSTKDRLVLFLQVCHAVQHAHQKGIIHRDIKPSNVMVTYHDGQPIPKVIDFGIAKATNQKLTEKTLFTRYAHIIGTPAYMSPEQAELSDLDIDTRSDIYSLGVLLYELLTGTTPFSEEELRKAGYLEMQRVIREQEPMKPSTRIRTAQVAQWRGEGILPLRVAGILPAIRGRDALDTKNMGGTPMLREVRGDLDWIVMKTLEKDRTRRYDTTSGLAEDIRRHLEHEPILARGPSAAYRLRKFLRRHQVQALLGLTVAVLIAIATIVLFQWNRDRQRLAEAEGFQRQAEALQDKEILSQARKQHAEGQRETALKTSQRIFDSPHAGPEARLLAAGILAEDGRSEEATAMLGKLRDERAEIAGAAHSLLARVLWESGALNAGKLKEIEDHRQQAEALLPRTAEAYFLRAMTAPTIKEQLAALDQALELDPKHYEARRLRAFTYYASRKYGPMSEEAFAMQVLRDRDPLGHSLRATALRELGRYQEALAEYDRALSLPGQEEAQYLDLATQRGETLLRMGSFDRLLLDAQEAQKRWPDQPIFQYYRFAALTALGQYDPAAGLFQQIVRSTPAARSALWSWAAKYVFDTLTAGRTWHPPDRAPAGAAFLPLAEAEETYRELSAQGHRLTTDGFSAEWSPDGKKLAFSMGVIGNSGVALYDPATKETDLLIVPGKYPRWSPDGKYLAFVRDRQFLRVPEFVAADPKNQPLAATDQEIWLMKSDGTEPRRLARGVSPSWDRDSTCVYYRSLLDSTLYSILIGSENTEPRGIMACPGYGPSVSPDNRCVAYMEGTSLKVKDLGSQSLVAEWPLPLPSDGWGASAWSPASNELCLGGSGGLGNRTGLWIYRLDQSEPTTSLGGPITVGSWAPDGTKLVFELGAPCFQIWTADLAPNVSATETLGPARTIEQHLRELVGLYAREAEIDPQDAYAYASRARCYDCLRERSEADADMKRWSAVTSGRSPSDLRYAMPRGLRHVIDLPFNCELVFSAERPPNETPVMSIAFGQKGRSEMKLFEVPMVVTSLVGLGFLAGLDAPPARADFTLGEPINCAIPSVNLLTDAPNCFSSDGLEMYIASLRGGGQGGFDLWVCRRASPEDDWGPVENLGPLVNSASDDWGGSTSGDGLELYFCSKRPGGYGGLDLYLTRRATRNSPWGPPTNLGPKVNSAYDEGSPWVSSDGLELYFTSLRPGGYGGMDIYVSKRATTQDPWGPAANLGAGVNSPFSEGSVCLSPDGLLLLFQDYPTPRPGGYGDYDLWMTRRASRSAPWEPAVNLGPKINAPTWEIGPLFVPDGSALYFQQGSGSIWTFMKAPITPIVDFNGDGKVDAKDMGILSDNWGKNTMLCDIGPFAWGDGVVDERDLRVLMESLMTPGPKASDVPCDVVLNWISPSFAQTCDVYLGTSEEAIKTASRTNPQGVLVSQKQTATTYDPPGLLEFRKTYYWRVDFVISSPAPASYQGPVLKFTTEAYARPIQNIIATACSFQRGMGPARTADGSGLDKDDGHSTTGSDMWLSQGTPPNWIQYQFDKVYTLHELWVWNQNQAVEPFIGFGAKTVKIEYSTDGAKWTPLANVPEFARAPGQPDYVHNTTVSFGGVSAKYVKLTIEKGWGATPSVGLSEVRFFYIPDRSATKP